METILIMARALEKASKNMSIDTLDIQYNTISDDYTGYVTLTWVDHGEWNRDIQSKYVIRMDGTVERLQEKNHD